MAIIIFTMPLTISENFANEIITKSLTTKKEVRVRKNGTFAIQPKLFESAWVMFSEI